MSRSLLVANRGEVARRIFRTARSMGIRCIAVYVEADADSPFVTEADLAVRLPDSYLDGAAVIAAFDALGITVGNVITGIEQILAANSP